MSENTSDITQEIDDVLEMSASEKRSSKNNKNVSPMEQLLKDHPMKMLQIGEKIEGLVVGIDSKALYIDLELFGSGIVYGKEIKDGFGTNRKKLEIGDKVVSVIQDLENEDGYVELSIREAVLEEAWKDLIQKRESRESVDTKILDANKGGLMVEINGVTGFMPVSQLTSEHYPRVEDGDKNKILEILRTYIGTEMLVCVLDVDQQEDKLIVSEKEANRDKEKTAISELKVGDIIEGDVSGVVDFGAFIKFFPPSKKGSAMEEDKLEGLVHISQLDWQLIDDPRKIIKVGDRIRAKIISIDDTRISLSVRDLKKDPWIVAKEKYNKDDIVKGKVHKINHFGAFVYLDDDIHGLAHISGFEEYPQKGIDEIVAMDGEYMWQIMSIEPSEHRMGLKYVGETEKVKPSKISEQKKVKEPESKKENGNDIKNSKKKAGKKKEEKSVKNKKEQKNKKEEKKEKKGNDKNGNKKKQSGKKESGKKKEPKDKNDKEGKKKAK